MMKSFRDKIHSEKLTKSKSKLKKIRNKKQRLKNKHILKYKNLENISFEDKRDEMYVPSQASHNHEFALVLFINKFMEKNLGKSWNQVFHELKEKVKYSKGNKKITFEYLLDLLTNPLYYRRSYFQYFVINDILIKKTQ